MENHVPDIADLAPLPDRLAESLRFLSALDALKRVNRRTELLDRSRPENSAEHSWHIAVTAAVLSEYASEPIDLSQVIKLLLVHDIVEIDAGDTFVYDPAGQEEKADREERAAERLFGLAPADIGRDLRATWEEFERGTSAEARFARAIDRYQPLVVNGLLAGGTWKAHGISRAEVEATLCDLRDAAPILYDHMQRLMDSSVTRGELLP